MGNYRKRVEARLETKRARKKMVFKMAGFAAVGVGLCMIPDLIVRSQKSSSDIALLNSAYDALIDISTRSKASAELGMATNRYDYTNLNYFNDSVSLAERAENLAQGGSRTENIKLAFVRLMNWAGLGSDYEDSVIREDQQRMQCAAQIFGMAQSGDPLVALDPTGRYIGLYLPKPCRGDTPIKGQYYPLDSLDLDQ